MNRVSGYRYCLLSFLVIYIIFLYKPVAGASETSCPSAPTVTAEAAVLLEARTGQVLFDKNAGQVKAPASTTKIMTALLAIECGDLDRVVTVSPAAASVGEASLDLRAGEKLKLEELVYGAMLESGNDACVAIAEHLAGSESNFILLMNQKARMIGAENTSFKNTNGLPATGHYTTARDLALIAQYALRNPVFQKIVSTKSKIIGSNESIRYLNNTNRLLWSYDWTDGIKTGTTQEAGNCLVSSGTRNGRQLISVVLRSDNRWRDSIKLLEYGFNCFELKEVVTEGEEFGFIDVDDGVEQNIKAVAQSAFEIAVPRESPGLLEKEIILEKSLIAPVCKSQLVGQVNILLNGRSVGMVRLAAGGDNKRQPPYKLFFREILKYKG
ncbi:D-alanyl-D-alanine carboxypeptidase family protein [Pelotomaculum propionicicum]|uniref:serine-type D-Ala-D-Ala carboxypeptidase n=1 Tax=Pelotomaculum propionicicum TaxID=258475 RepID=A0A4Y7RBR2_9FIRM|nr:D-alanyl-D-alanine carboxypeptidase family protein [Pelotomaculum propionicicum]NLI11977.1 D-alanyl-D-alanine carboxypeptidase [Peptococcaceae bacterium]TEB06424.1 D-alanyl-D-alanine carboxypeptidase DacB [Pelotomaculum propionicicum]